MWILLLISLSAPVQVLPLSDPGTMIECFESWQMEYDRRTKRGAESLIGESLICMRIEE